MGEDIIFAIDTITQILTEALDKRKKENIELERIVRNFWAKMRKLVGEDLCNNLEEDPYNKAYTEDFKEKVAELMNRQNFKMNVVMFLYNMGIEIP